jgi:RHS repeat-associated protein
MALGNGQQTQYVYYTARQQGGRLYQIKTGPTGSPTSTLYLQYGYDRVGNVMVITDHNNSGQLQLFSYDALDRLTSAAAIGGLDGYYTRTYLYDAIGNLTLGDGGYYYYESSRPHAVTTVGNPPSSITAYYGYDGNGSATFITRTLLSMTYTLTYDPENRVKQVVPSDGPTATFRYDGDGTRVLGIVGGVTTTYAGTWYEYTTAGVSYYYLNGQRIAVRTGSGVTYIHRDHLGSAVTTTGVLTQGQRYDAWGETRGTSAVDTPYRYTGQRQEDDLLLYFYNARWYDAALGRFIQADSIVPEPGNPQSLNRYSYVLNNPLKYTDPSGSENDPFAQGGIASGWDPEWVERYKQAHSGDYPRWQDWFDYQLSLSWPGTGPNGSWTDRDWQDYTQVRSLLGESLLREIGHHGGIQVALLGLLGMYLYDPMIPTFDTPGWRMSSLFPEQEGALTPGPDGTMVGWAKDWPQGIIVGQAGGFALGNVIILSVDHPDNSTLCHELTHVLQYRAAGFSVLFDYLFRGMDKSATDLQAQAVDKHYGSLNWPPPIWLFVYVEY